MNELVNTDTLKEREFLTVKEVEGVLGISEMTVYRYVDKGFLHPIRYRNRNYFRSVDLINYLNGVFDSPTVSNTEVSV